MEALVAPELVQLRVAEAPGAIGDVPVNVPVGGGTTVTVACSVCVPPGPVRVSVYVVVDEGETLTLPPPGGVTPPTPLSIVAPVALLPDHVSVEELPTPIVAGDAENEPVGVTAAC